MTLFSLVVHAQPPEITNGLNYLTSSQNADGTWEGNTSLSETTDTTATAIETLKVLNQNTGTPYTNAVAWLQGQSPSSVGYIAEKVRVLGLTDGTVDDLLPSRDQAKGAWGGDVEYVTNNLDTVLALQALKASNYSDQSFIFSAISYLLSTQNSDGGWGLVQGDDSNVFVTSHVLSTLAQFKTVYLMEQQISKAAALLLSAQNSDGGFGTGASTVYETALAFIAITESGHGQLQPMLNAINYLSVTQSANGSWNDDPYSTALALRALAGVKPDLAIGTTDITASPSSPMAGDSITITGTVHNIGLETAGGVTVKLLDNGNTIGEQLVGDILPGATVSAAFAIAPFSPTGEHILTMSIDPANTIAEWSKANNTAVLRLWAKAPADLVVAPEYLGFAPANPKPGENVTLTANIANMGESAAGAFSAELYDGDPDSGGALLGSFNSTGIAAGEWGSGTITFRLSTAGTHSLYLVADRQNSITEQNKTNNTATATLTTGDGSATGTADLAIGFGGLLTAPARPRNGDSTTITVMARNLGGVAASSTMELFDGLPDSGGTLLHQETVTLNAGESRAISFPWQATPGVHTLYAVLDRANLVAETDESNNSQTLLVMTDMVDIEVSASDISIDPERPMDGDPATVKVTVRNRGIKATGQFNVSLYNGDPANGGTLLQTFAVTDLPGDGTDEISYPFTAARGAYRFYAVCDPENKVAELSKDNNIAIRSLLVKSSAEAKGPDLVPLELDLSKTDTDPQSLRISGMARVKFQNKGDDKIATPFRVTVFEDRDNDGIYTEGTDLSLGWWDYGAPMNPNMVGMVDINLAGTLTFRDAPIYAMADSSQAVFEQNENNNSIRRGSACEARPAKPIEPVVKWQWDGNEEGECGAIDSMPALMNIPDGSGAAKTVVLLVSVLTNPYRCQGTMYGKLHAYDGKTGRELFTFYDPNHPIYRSARIATGDINNDGLPEIIIPRAGNEGFVCLRNDGSLLWDNSDIVRQWNIQHGAIHADLNGNGYPAIADTGGNGNPEIILGSTAVNADGTVHWGHNIYQNGGVGDGGNGIQYSSIVVDIDMDGKQEIIAGNAVYNYDGSIRWINNSLPDGINAVGNFDDDPYPEIVYLSKLGALKHVLVYLLEHDGSIKWGPVDISNLEPGAPVSGSPPVVADFDGDGQPEVGIKGYNNFFILDKDGLVKKSFSIYPGDYQPMAPAVFDLNGDGKPEVMFLSGSHFGIYDGSSGKKLYDEPFGEVTDYNDIGYQNVFVADVDGDGHAEIIVVGGNPSIGSSLPKGIKVFGAKDNDWMGTRSIWNQPSYHVTNINDDGSIPRYETPSWLANNSYLCNVPVNPAADSPYKAADISASYVRVDMADYPNSVTITSRIGNGGAKAVDTGLDIAFHDGDPANGGVLLGTASTTKPLNPGEYEDVSFTWSSPTEGNHTLYVTADPDNTISECDKNNNTVSVPVFVTSGKPDMSVVAEDVVVPTTIPEGSLASVAITVRNIGTLSANNIPLRLYAGNPASGGKQIGADQVISNIPAGGAATVMAAWNTLGVEGATWLYAVVDPAGVITDINRGNNTAIREVQVTPADKPDLQIAAEDISVIPASPGEGEPLTISVNVHNRGLATGNVKLTLYNGNPAAGGKVASTTVIPQAITMGGSTGATFTLDSTGISGTIPMFVKVDPDNRIDESDETNNLAGKTVTIAPAGLTLGALTDKSSYGADENVRVTISATNLKAEARSVTFDVQILDKNGALTATAATGVPLSLAANAAVNTTATWNTGSTPADGYTASVLVKEGGRTIAKATLPFIILPVKTVNSVINVDKISYTANNNVTLTAAITSASPNFSFTGLNARFSILDSAGVQKFAENRTVNTLAVGQRIELKTLWSTGVNTPGAYAVKFEVMDGSTPLSSANTTFRIIGSAATGDGLTGSVTPVPDVVEAGTDVTISYSVANKGNEDIPSPKFNIVVADPENSQTIATETVFSDTPLETGGAKNGDISVSTRGVAPGKLLAIIQYAGQETARSIASAPFTVQDTVPPVLTVSTLNNGAYTNHETLNIAGTVHDDGGVGGLQINGAPVTVNVDGSFSYALALQEGPNLITTTAYDLGGNPATDTRTVILDRTAPLLVVSSPADNTVTSTGMVTVSGTVDENSTVQAGPDGAMQYAVLNNNAFTATVNLKPGMNTILIVATDLAGNTSSQKRTIIFDNINPTLAITDPAQDIRTNRQTLVLKGTAEDSLTDVVLSIDMDGISYTPVVENGTFEQELSFAEEKTYTVTATATDAAGNETSVSRNIIYDITGPTLTIDPVSSPTDQSEQTVSGTREEGSPVSVTCPTATVGAVSYTSGTTWESTLTNLQLGENVVAATSADDAGNKTEVSATIVVQTNKPDLVLIPWPHILWPPNHKMVPVILSGWIINPCRSDIKSVKISVTDEYGKFNYSNLHFGSVVWLQAWREGNDKDGRVYTVTAVATHKDGRKTSTVKTVIVPHDVSTCHKGKSSSQKKRKNLQNKY